MREDNIRVRLGEFAVYEKGKKPKNEKKFPDDKFYIPYVDIEAFEKGRIKSYTDGEGCKFCKSDDFLMVWDGARSGLVSKGVNGALGSTLMKINFPRINNDYILYFLQSKFIEINTRAKGTGTPHVDPDLLWNYYFPLVSIPEQRAIVAKIEELFSELDNGVANLNKAKEKLEIYRQAVLKKAFEGELTKEWREKETDLPTGDEILNRIRNERIQKYEEQMMSWKKELKEWETSGKSGDKPVKPRKAKELSAYTEEDLSFFIKLPQLWKWVKIDTIHGFMQNAIKAGPFGSALKKSCYVEKGYKIYGQEQVISGDWHIGDYYVDDEKFEELKSCEVKPNDILISLVGTVGKVLVLPKDIIPGIINPRLIKVSLAEKFYSPYFFKYYFESSYLKSIYSTKSHGATMDIINLGIIQELPFPLLTIEEQEKIVELIDDRLSICDYIMKNINDALTTTNSLRQSILKQAFEGKLLTETEVEMCRKEHDWEPAEILLEKIKNELRSVK